MTPEEDDDIGKRQITRKRYKIGRAVVVVVVVVFFFEYNKSWTSVNSILLRYNGVGIFNCRSFGITEL